MLWGLSIEFYTLESSLVGPAGRADSVLLYSHMNTTSKTTYKAVQIRVGVNHKTLSNKP